MADRVGQQFGNYRLTRLIGKGGFAEVYLAEHMRLNVHAAIKILHAQLPDEYVNSFLSEAQTIARLVHPQIIRIFDYDVEESTPFLVMDYAPHGTLRQRHPNGTRFPLNIVIQYVKQVAAALQYANDQNVIHRDVKPANMLVGRNQEILLSDFGIATIAQGTQTLDLAPKQVQGTPFYMAPEQFQGKTFLSTDQYSLGVIVYEWLCGSVPFQGAFYELASQHLSAPPPSLRERIPDIPPDVEQVVMTALAKDPRQRFSKVQAFANALEEACSTSSSLFPTSIPPSLPGRTSSISSANPGSVNAPVQAQSQTPLSAVPSASSTDTDNTVVPIPGQVHTPPIAQAPDHPRITRGGKSQRRRRNKILWISALITLLILLVPALYGLYSIYRSSHKMQAFSGIGIGDTILQDGEDIGLSDGTFAFDTNRPDGYLKLQAADKLRAKDIAGAEALWRQAIQQETNDAEALIYLEDQRVLASGHPYITFVVGTVLTGDAFLTGHDNLQGAYIAQKEANEGMKLPTGIQVRLLIANSGNESLDATMVAEQIVQAAKLDKTIVGVMGWPFDGASRYAAAILAAAHIPMISQSATSDALTAISPYFFRVVPPIMQQAAVGAQYAEQTFHAKKAALFIDPGNTYSKALGTDFQQQFVAAGNTVVVTENYTSGRSDTLPGLLLDALRSNPDLVYFSGAPTDVTFLLTALPISGPFANLPVMGGDALYDSYPVGAHTGFGHLHFTAFVYPTEWDVLGLTARKPAFFSEYPHVFDPRGEHPANTYGYTRAKNATLLSYDAALALLAGCQIALAGGKKSISPGDLQQGLTQITGSQAIQGVSGRIAFGADGNPVDKAVVILGVDTDGNVEMDSVRGTFLASSY